MRLTWRKLALLALFSVVLTFSAVDANAQLASPPSPSASAASAASAASEIGPIDRLTIWIYQKQREFHRALTNNLRAFSRTGEVAVAFTLIGASFLYGFFHAAGPGHGKAVMTGYLVTHRETVRRGVSLAVAAAFCQGLVAIFLVYGLMTLFGFMPRETQGAVTWSERASFLLVALVGGYLLYRGVRGLFLRIKAARLASQVTVHNHAPASHSHSHAHGHDHEECCGHTHMPSADAVASASDFKTKLGVVLSIGIRPCTGAVIILVFAKAVSLAWIGIAAVFAMSAGTALAIASLAAATVGVRSFATRFSIAPPKFAAHAADVAAALGGAFILLIGLSLLSTAFGPSHPLMG